MTLIVQGRECVLGIDVASHQHPNNAAIDWDQVRAAGYEFVYVKATEGLGYKNPWLGRDVDGANKAGMKVGCYHWIKPGLSVSAQREFFLNAVADMDLSLPHALDVEEEGVHSSDVSQWIRPGEVIYIGAFFNVGSHPLEWADHPLWLPAYGPNTPSQDPTRMRAPTVASPWPAWTIWQFNSTGRVPGVPSANVDRNVADATWFRNTTQSQEDDMPLTADEIETIAERVTAHLANPDYNPGTVIDPGARGALDAINVGVNDPTSGLRTMVTKLGPSEIVEALPDEIAREVFELLKEQFAK